jgi:hypothetical protein
LTDKKRIIDFWYEFDRLFNPRFGEVPSDIDNAERFESGLLSGWLTDRNEMNMQNYSQNFQDRINMSDDLINAISLLAENQLNMINEKLDGDDILIQKAFEYFGQGVLFDDFSDGETNQPRRPSDDRVHMMDSIHFGYPRWHVFCRSAGFIGLDQDIWLKIDRLIGLAYALHMRLAPRRSGLDGSDPQNPEQPSIVAELGPMFEASSYVQLDEHFDNRFVRALFGHI